MTRRASIVPVGAPDVENSVEAVRLRWPVAEQRLARLVGGAAGEDEGERLRLVEAGGGGQIPVELPIGPRRTS